MNWKYKLEEDYDFEFNRTLNSIKDYRGVRLSYWGFANISPWEDNITEIRINKGYAWDGATPKFSILDLFWIGIPDGCLWEGKSKLYYPTLIHDFLLQFREELGLTRKECDDRFLEEMKRVNFKLRYVYYWSVRIFGWIKIFARK